MANNKFSGPTKSWRIDLTTDKQKWFLEKLGNDGHAPILKGEASDLISSKLPADDYELKQLQFLGIKLPVETSEDA